MVRVVVGAALVRADADGRPRVLAARRRRPVHLAGLWELPGGKVEPGEGEADALVRECREELGVEVEVDGRVGEDLPVTDGLVLRVHRARTTGEPQPREHDELRWLAAHELDDVAWLPADAPLLPELRDLLAPPAGSPTSQPDGT